MTAPAPPTGIAPHRRALNTATLGHREPIAMVVERVARHGFAAIAPWRRDLDGHDVEAVARHIREAGLSVSGYCRSTYYPAATAAEAAAAIADNRRALDEAAALGAPCFLQVVGGLPAGSRDLAGARRQVEDGIAAVLEQGRRRGVSIALEPLHPMYAADRSCLSTLAQALDLCDRLDPDRQGGIGVVLDAYHLWWDPDLRAGIARARGRIDALHVSDWLVPTRDLLLDRGMMGDGVIDLAAFCEAADAAGYGGPVEVEIFSAADWWRRDPDEVLQICQARLDGISVSGDCP